MLFLEVDGFSPVDYLFLAAINSSSSIFIKVNKMLDNTILP